jgi:hypothetical protein
LGRSITNKLVVGWAQNRSFLSSDYFIRLNTSDLSFPSLLIVQTYHFIMSNEMSESVTQRENIAEALSKVAFEGQNYMSNGPGAREKLIASARELITATESPMESLLWAIWAQVQITGPRILFPADCKF